MRKRPPLSHRAHHEHVLGPVHLHDGTQLGQKAKTRQKLDFKKIVKLTDHSYACKSLIKFSYESRACYDRKQKLCQSAETYWNCLQVNLISAGFSNFEPQYGTGCIPPTMTRFFLPNIDFYKNFTPSGMVHDICTPCISFPNLLPRFLRGFAKVEGKRRGPGGRQQLKRDHQDHPGGQWRGRLDVRGRRGVKRGQISCKDPVC